jgi:hypothetical protein
MKEPKGLTGMGKKQFKITEEMLKNANDYIPIQKKVEIAKAIAPDCIEKSKTAEQNQKGLEFLALPMLWVDDMEKKSLYTMYVFLTEYLKLDVSAEFASHDYDRFASAHIINQMERFKNVDSLKGKIFDILSDFRDFKKILDTEIYNEKEVRNDPVARLSAAISIVSDPENIKKMQQALEQKTEEFEIAQREAKAKISGKGDET